MTTHKVTIIEAESPEAIAAIYRKIVADYAEPDSATTKAAAPPVRKAKANPKPVKAVVESAASEIVESIERLAQAPAAEQEEAAQLGADQHPADLTSKQARLWLWMLRNDSPFGVTTASISDFMGVKGGSAMAMRLVECGYAHQVQRGRFRAVPAQP